MNADRYKRVLQEEMKHLGGRIFQQDGASCHTAKKVTTYIASKNVRLLENWPAYSPDLNPIETLWAWMRSAVSREHPQTEAELKKAIGTWWDNLPQGSVDKLCLSFKSRCELCIKRGGGA